MTLPVDLAGYQTIEYGPIQVGDIVCMSAFAYPEDSCVVSPISGWIGAAITSDIRVYRKMDCPRKLDDLPDVEHKAKTDDEGKPPMAHLPWAGIKAVSRVQAYGHKKYHDYNNYRKGMEVGRNLSCAIRHISAFMEGETLDPESQESHLAHAATRLLFVLQNQHDGVAIDDRFKQ